MELTFDYYKNAQDPEIYLCNPDKSILGALYAKNKNFVLRFNSISDFTFEVPKYITSTDGTTIEHPYYKLVETKRLIKVEKIGWFRIIQSVENESAAGISKSITAESHQAVFKDMGFVEENRLYKFYDATDEKDERYDASNVGAVPSVIGQLYQQLGIRCNLNIGDVTPEDDYDDWTIIYIEDALKYRAANENNICRTLTGNDGLFGYDFMVSDAADAFQVIFDFDFMHHTIKIKSTENITQKTNIYLSFENLMQDLEVTEKSDEIVTVLSCKGTDIDIASVNPMGTDYICDFSYYIGNDQKGYPWMSRELTNALVDWRQLLNSKKATYADLVKKLYDLYVKKTALESQKKSIDLKLKDCETARDQYISNANLSNTIFTAETIESGECSLEVNSVFYSKAFSKDSSAKAWKCYKEPPTYSSSTNGYYFASNDYKSGTTLEACFEQDSKYVYFIDEYEGDKKSYCKLIASASVVDGKEKYFVSGFERMARHCGAGYWCSLYSKKNTKISSAITTLMGENDSQDSNTINGIYNAMREISNSVNILKYFSNKPALFRELKCYWVDGQYTNDALKAVDGTTVADNLGVAKELMEAGETELNRVCQPRFSFTVTAANFLKIPEFLKFAKELALGKVVTVEKDESTHYQPALTEMSFSLDSSDDFTLTFSNALKLTDWGYTYADLIKSASSTSRTVETNWSNLIDYSQSKDEINQLLYNTLDRTLRAGLDNAYNQEFVIDDTGILGRKKLDDGTFSDAQLRVTNNLIVFTRDNWQTACTALGKIAVPNGQGGNDYVYGLAGEYIIGKIFVGNQLTIANEAGNVKITGDGIELTGYAKTEDLQSAEQEFKVAQGELSSKLTNLEGTQSTLQQTVDGIQTTVNNIQGDYVTSSQLSQTANNITASVQGDVDTVKGQISLCLKQDNDGKLVSEVTIESGKLKIDTDYFKVDTDGRVQCSDIELTGGVIKSSNISFEPVISRYSLSIYDGCSYRTTSTPIVNTSMAVSFAVNGTHEVSDSSVIEITSAEITGFRYRYNDQEFDADSSHVSDADVVISGKNISYKANVTTDPHLYGSSANLQPSVYAVKITYSVKYKKGETVTKGAIIDLTNGIINFPKFKVDENGRIDAKEAYLSGEVRATRGIIGSFDITEEGDLRYVQDEDDGSGTNFKISARGYMMSISRKIGTTGVTQEALLSPSGLSMGTMYANTQYRNGYIQFEEVGDKTRSGIVLEYGLTDDKGYISIPSIKDTNGWEFARVPVIKAGSLNATTTASSMIKEQIFYSNYFSTAPYVFVTAVRSNSDNKRIEVTVSNVTTSSADIYVYSNYAIDITIQWVAIEKF